LSKALREPIFVKEKNNVTSAFIDSIQVEMAQQADAAYSDRYLEGSTDAAFGHLPEYADDAYLAGYIAKLKELPKGDDGHIQHYSPRQHFAFGRMDDPNPSVGDEF
jgi:hypothetical protein